MTPGREVLVTRHPVRDASRADLVLGPNDPLGHRRFRDEERVGDLGRRQAAEQSQGQRHLRLPREGGVAAGEDQAQSFVLHGSLLVRAVSRIGCVERHRLGLTRLPGGLAPEPVDGPAASGRDDPACRAGRHTSRGQRSTATVNASCTASSARSMSPRARMSTDTARPCSARKTRAMSALVTAMTSVPSAVGRRLAGLALPWNGRTSTGSPVALAMRSAQPRTTS